VTLHRRGLVGAGELPRVQHSGSQKSRTFGRTSERQDPVREALGRSSEDGLRMASWREERICAWKKRRSG
jgi:hypothetical protein